MCSIERILLQCFRRLQIENTRKEIVSRYSTLRCIFLDVKGRCTIWLNRYVSRTALFSSSSGRDFGYKWSRINPSLLSFCLTKDHTSCPLTSLQSSVFLCVSKDLEQWGDSLVSFIFTIHHNVLCFLLILIRKAKENEIEST